MRPTSAKLRAQRSLRGWIFQDQTLPARRGWIWFCGAIVEGGSVCPRHGTQDFQQAATSNLPKLGRTKFSRSGLKSVSEHCFVPKFAIVIRIRARLQPYRYGLRENEGFIAPERVFPQPGIRS